MFTVKPQFFMDSFHARIPMIPHISWCFHGKSPCFAALNINSPHGPSAEAGTRRCRVAIQAPCGCCCSGPKGAQNTWSRQPWVRGFLQWIGWHTNTHDGSMLMVDFLLMVDVDPLIWHTYGSYGREYNQNLQNH